MSRFQYGDGRVDIEGQPYRLRLTLGGLAELDARFGISGPKDLAARVLTMSPADGRTLLEVLLQSEKPLAAELSDTAVVELLPKICRVMETSFGVLHV